jgi:hypothetical protein
MFFNQFDERNAMVKSIIASEEVGRVGQSPKKSFPSSELGGIHYTLWTILSVNTTYVARLSYL